MNQDIASLPSQSEEERIKLAERLNLATHAAQMGIWDWDIRKNELVWDDQMYRLYGLKPGDFGGAYEAWLNGVHPDDRAPSNEASQMAVRGEKEYDTEFRVLWPDGSIHWLKANGQVFRDEAGNPLRMVGVNYDITARWQAEERLKESEEYLRLGYEAGNLGIWKNDLQTGSVEFDERARIHYGFDTLHTTLLEVTKRIHPDDLARVGSETEAATSPHGSGKFATEYRVVHADGSVRWLAIGVQVKFEGEGAQRHPVIGYGTTQDITGRKRAENELRENNSKLELAMQTANMSWWEMDITNGNIKFDKRKAEMLGYSPENFKHYNDFMALVHPEDFDLTMNAMQRHIDGIAEQYEVEYRILSKSDGYKWFHDLGAILKRDSKGIPLYAAGLVIDITKRKQAEKKIQVQLQRLSALSEIDRAINSNLEMYPSLEILLNEVLAQLNVDASCVLLLDVPNQTLKYMAGKGFRSPDIRQSCVQIGQGVAGRVGLEHKTLHITDLNIAGNQFQFRDFLKEENFVEYFGVPLIVKGLLKGVLEVFNRTAITPDLDWLNYMETLGGQAAIAIENAQLLDGLKHSNAELEQRVKTRTADLLRVNTELEHANRTKDEFLANMSHELRTPLSGILGLTEVIQLGTYGQPNEKQSHALKIIETSGHHLLELINDILDLSKIESGKFDIYPEMLDIDDTCRASLVFVREQAAKKSIGLDYQNAPDVKSVFADSRRLKQILVNLLSNAVKFTPEKGKVALAVRADPEKGQIHFSVTDTGIGIAKEDTDRLFTPFTQVDSRLNRQYEGTGLGLVLVLRLAEMHGGNVQVETEPGKGSRFTVSLPWQLQVNPLIETEPSYIEAQAESAPNSSGLLLLAEDNASNIEAIDGYLKFKGYTLVIASNGVEALVKAEESNPDLILMDIQMPVMDGLEATRRLRADPRFASTPIIALTALAMTGDRERCIEAGATDYLSKPFSLKELTEKIGRLLRP